MLDKIHKISEIVAAFAIVGSLIFVGLQLRQNTQAMEYQEDNSNWTPWINLSQMAAASPDLANIIVRGQSVGLDGFSEGENFRFGHYHSALFNVMELNFRAASRNPLLSALSTMRSPVYDAVSTDERLTNKGSREWWLNAKGYYQPDFVAWVDQISAEDKDQ